jgi:ABC-type branched-subunit amino acid transport system substrate-binding protein
MLEKDKVFGFVQNLGTPNNLAIWDRLDKQCVPNLLVSNGAPALVDPVNHPFTIIANAPYPAEAAAFVDYVEKNKPGARIASISENSDFGKSYRTPLTKLTQGRNVTLATQQTYEPSDPNVSSQFTAIAASKANALFVGAAAVKCPQSLDAAAGKGIDITYVSANCTSKAILGLAKPANVNGVLSESASMDPSNPAVQGNPRVKLYLAKMKQYAPSVDPRNSSIAYGWTEGAILSRILDASPSLDRVAVINTAHNLTIADGVGLLGDGVVWKTSGIADPYPIESFRLQRWDSAAGHFVPLPELTSFEGKSASFVR